MQSHIMQAKKPGITKKIGWIVMLLLAALMFLLASRYLTLNPQVYFAPQKTVYIAHVAILLMHIIGSMFAIFIGPFQFLSRIRTGRFLNLHRWLGRLYLVSVLVGGLGGLYMAQLAYGGLPSRLGFTALALLWLLSGVLAYVSIRNKQIDRHRRWMIRNYALTFAAVTLRLWQAVFQVAGVDFVTGYMTVAWLSWIPNLMVAEWLIRQIRLAQHRPALA